MGSSYCLSSDKKAIQNELTIINVQEENLEEKKMPPTSNQYINTTIDKKNNKNENHSNLTNQTNQNQYTSQLNTKNNSSKKVEIKKILAVPISNTANTVISKNKLVVLNNDVIVSGNEVNPEKIYIKNSCGRHQPNISNILHKDLNRSASIRKLL